MVQYGTASEHIRKRLILSRTISIFVVLAVLALIAVILSDDSYGPIDRIMLFLVVTIPAVLVAWLIVRRVNRVSGQYRTGQESEDRAALELNSLPPGFSVFRGVRVDNRGDIDFVVAGPTGVFAVEVKGHAGKITLEGESLLRDGRNFDKDILRQARGEAMAVRRFLETNINKKIFVHAILVFTNPRATFHFSNKFINGVHVLAVPELATFLAGGPRNFPKELQTASENALKKVV